MRRAARQQAREAAAAGPKEEPVETSVETRSQRGRLGPSYGGMFMKFTPRNLNAPPSGVHPESSFIQGAVGHGSMVAAAFSKRYPNRVEWDAKTLPAREGFSPGLLPPILRYRSFRRTHLLCRVSLEHRQWGPPTTGPRVPAGPTGQKLTANSQQPTARAK